MAGEVGPDSRIGVLTAGAPALVRGRDDAGRLLRLVRAASRRDGYRRHLDLTAVSLISLCWLLVVVVDHRSGDLVAIGIGAAVMVGVAFGFVPGVLAGTASFLVVSPLGPARPALPTAGWLLDGAVALALGAVAGWRSHLIDRRDARSEDMAARLATTYLRTLELMAETVELRDPITAGHSRRVATNAHRLAVAAGTTGEEADAIYWSGMLHDVGKIAIPESILQKPGPLDEDEMAVMRTHAELGANLISKTSPDLAPLAAAVATHHECWDGSGYPAGLAGQDIPRAGRVLAIVDVFDALTSARPYRDPLPPGAALDYIADNAGTLFDPVLARLFCDLTQRGETPPAIPFGSPARTE